MNFGPDVYPEIVINSINMTVMLHIIQEQNWEGLIGMLSNAVNSLARAGAAFAIIASNTPHIVFEQVQRGSPIPLSALWKRQGWKPKGRAQKAACWGYLHDGQQLLSGGVS
jgi:aspartate/glutamate racemase